MNFFKLYIGDYQRDTGSLTLAEHGAYLLMLQHLYATERALPTGRELHRLLRAETKAEREAIDHVAARYFTLTDEGYVNDRAMGELRRGAAQRAVNRSVGKRGGRPRKGGGQGGMAGAVSGAVETDSLTDSETDSVSASVGAVGPCEVVTNQKNGEKNVFLRDFDGGERGSENSSKNAQVVDFKGGGKTESVSESVSEQEPNENPNQTPDTRLNTVNSKNTQLERLRAGACDPPPNAPGGAVCVGPSMAAAVCVALRAEGMQRTNPAHPALLALVQHGAGVDVFVAAWREVRQGGRAVSDPFAYVLGCVRGQLAQAEQAAQAALAAPGGVAGQVRPGRHGAPGGESFRERDARLQAERVAQFAPALADRAALAGGAGAGADVLDVQAREVRDVAAIGGR